MLYNDSRQNRSNQCLQSKISKSPVRDLEQGYLHVYDMVADWSTDWSTGDLKT